MSCFHFRVLCPPRGAVRLTCGDFNGVDGNGFFLVILKHLVSDAVSSVQFLSVCITTLAGSSHCREQGAIKVEALVALLVKLNERELVFNFVLDFFVFDEPTTNDHEQSFKTSS